METHNVLRQIMSSPWTHACWLNSLSYLEFRGFRKIVRSQTTSDMDLEMLSHAMEEVRHALFFKRQAVKLGGDEFKYYREQTLLAESGLKTYFFSLDRDIAEVLEINKIPGMPRATYCIVTLLVELRAMSLYRDYQGLLADAKSDFTLAGILNEEYHHLQEMISESEKILNQNFLTLITLKKIEEKHFSELWIKIKNALLIEKVTFVHEIQE